MKLYHQLRWSFTPIHVDPRWSFFCQMGTSFWGSINPYGVHDHPLVQRNSLNGWFCSFFGVFPTTNWFQNVWPKCSAMAWVCSQPRAVEVAMMTRNGAMIDSSLTMCLSWLLDFWQSSAMLWLFLDYLSRFQYVQSSLTYEKWRSRTTNIHKTKKIFFSQLSNWVLLALWLFSTKMPSTYFFTSSQVPSSISGKRAICMVVPSWRNRFSEARFPWKVSFK